MLQLRPYKQAWPYSLPVVATQPRWRKREVIHEEGNGVRGRRKAAVRAGVGAASAAAELQVGEEPPYFHAVT